MLNPSIANAEIDDPTIRRCMNFARREAAGGIEVLNLFALRATDPKDLRKATDPIGPDNDQWIREVLHPHYRVVAAWGRRGEYLGRALTVLRNLRKSGIRRIECLGDRPNHPLYIRADQPLIELLR